MSEQKCNHRIKSKNTSIAILEDQRTFTVPEHVFGICKVCGKHFHFIKGEDGALLIYTDKKSDHNSSPFG